MTETEVFNAVRSYLATLGAVSLQLVPPGGQASISITFTQDGRRKTCFPDLIAWLDGTIWVGELKPRYSEQDRQKVANILEFGSEILIERCRRIIEMPIGNVKGVLCHGQIDPPIAHGMAQWVFHQGFHIQTMEAH